MDEINRKQLIEQAKKEASEWQEGTNNLRSALVRLAIAFEMLADIKYLETSLLCKSYFKTEDPAFAEELSGKLSRPIAFGLPDELTEDKLLVLVAQTAMDCVEEMALSRQACSIIDPSQLTYNAGFYEKSLEMIKNYDERRNGANK